MKLHNPLPARLLALAIAAVVAGPVFAHEGHGHEEQQAVLGSSAKTDAASATSSAKSGGGTLRPPMSPEEFDRLRQIQRADHSASRLKKLSAKAEADPCNGNLPQFGALRGAALVQLIKDSSTGCVRKLFRINEAESQRVFTEQSLVAVANALQANAGSYAGNNDSSTLQLIFFLRAGLYQNWKLASAPAVKPALQRALDTLFANPRFKDVSDENGEVAAEAILLISNSFTQARYLPVLIDLLNRFNGTWNNHWMMQRVITSAHTVLYDASNNRLEDFVAAVQQRTDLADALFNLHTRNRAMLNTANAYLLNNNARELGRLLSYGEPLRSRISGYLKTMLRETSLPGPSGGVWMEAASAVKYYDNANCRAYQVCDLDQLLAKKLLPVDHYCSPTVRLRAQQLAPAQVQEACDALAAEENHFHEKLKTNRQPIPGDVNSTLELVIFHSSSDYTTYSGVMFGNRTDNGGMYLEGDSTRPGNQARFIAYEAEWLRDKGEFKIWNLEHEYTHYLDGRFDTKGNYADAMRVDPNNWDSAPINTVWYTEGLAEYISKKDDNPQAIELQKERRMALSHIMMTPDEPWDVDRVYRGGYLGVRFMFERHPGEVQTMLNFFRAGDFVGYQKWLVALGTRFDAEFAAWFDDLANGNTTPDLRHGVSIGLPASDQGQVRSYGIDIPFGTAKLAFKLSGGEGEGDLIAKFGTPVSLRNYQYYSWKDGNTDVLTLNAPSAGKWYVGTYARGAFSGASLTAEVVPMPSCHLDANGTLAPHCVLSGLAGGTRYIPFWLPEGAKNLKVETTGGSGDLDIFVGQGFYPNVHPNDGRYTAASTNAGNREEISLRNPVGGSWYYLTLMPKETYAGVKLTVSYDSPQ